jgi:hypothetical protein
MNSNFVSVMISYFIFVVFLLLVALSPARAEEDLTCGIEAAFAYGLEVFFPEDHCEWPDFIPKDARRIVMMREVDEPRIVGIRRLQRWVENRDGVSYENWEFYRDDDNKIIVAYYY